MLSLEVGRVDNETTILTAPSIAISKINRIVRAAPANTTIAIISTNTQLGPVTSLSAVGTFSRFVEEDNIKLEKKKQTRRW